jgi:hypothetical protein
MFEDPPMTPDQRRAEIASANSEPLLDQLQNDVRSEVARHLPNFRAREAEFGKITSSELLPIYLNWRHRQIHPHPRTVQLSSELSQRIRGGGALYEPVKSEFAELIRIIEMGRDLLTIGLLSSAVVRKPYELKPDYSDLNGEDHLDLLLNEQGIHHLHLPGLAGKRGTPIVFGIFELDYAVLLDVARHDDYQTDRLAKISYGNWPGRHYVRMPIDRLVDGQGSTIDLKDQQRVGVRNNAVNTPIKIGDGIFVMSRAGGVAANGFAISVVRRSQEIWKSLALFTIRQHRPRFDEYFLESTGVPLPENPVFHFRFLSTEKDWSYGIVEERSKCVFWLPNYFGVTRGLAK